MNDQRTFSQEYFDWLYSKIRANNKRLNHRHLLDILFKKDFRWTVNFDENRCDDGLELREIYIQEFNIDEDHLEVQYFLKRKCSVLEVLVGLAIRMNDLEHILEDPKNHTNRWFHELLKNLKLDEFTDELGPIEEAEVDDILERWLGRTYDFFGRGGAFPLKKRPLKDQTRVELWYQMMSYLAENYT